MFKLSQLRPIDIHFGDVIQSAYRNLDDSNISEGFKSFLSRDEKKRVFRGRYDSPRSFLAALRRYQEQQVEQKIKRDGGGDVEEVIHAYNQAKLPAVWYYRNLDYRVSTSEHAKASLKGMRLFVDNKPIALDGIYLDVTYRIIFTAYDTMSLDELVTAFFLYVQSPLREPEITDISDFPLCPLKRNRGFDVPYKLGLTAQAAFDDLSMLSAEVIPGVHEDGRIYAAEIAEFPVVVPIMRAIDVDLEVDIPKSMTICVESKSLGVI